MALSAKWLDGDLIFYDGIQEVYRIKNSTEGIVVGTTGAGVPSQFHGNITYSDPTTTATTGSTGIVALSSTSNRMQFISNSSGQKTIMTLPDVEDSAGIEFKIVNTSTDGNVDVNCSGAALTAIIENDEVGYLLCDGTNWGAMVAGPSTGT